MSNRDESRPLGRGAPNDALPRAGVRPGGVGGGRLVTLLALGLLVARAAATDRPDVENWQGIKVLVPESNTAVRLDGAVVAVLNAGSVFRVGKAEPGRLWLDAENLRGWVRAREVLPLKGAAEHFSDLIRRRPDDPSPWVGRGIARLVSQDFAGAVADLTEATRRDPRDFWAYHNRSAAHHARRDFRLALADAEAAARLNPDEPAHLANRAAALFALGEYAKAADDYTRALRRLTGGETSLDDPSEGPDGRGRARLWAVRWTCARAECWESLRESERALGDLASALRLDPYDFATLNSLAWMLATCHDTAVRDGKRAFELAARACDLTNYADHACIGTLAAALAELGDRSGAVRWLRRALELSGGDGPRAAGYRERLDRLQGDATRGRLSGAPRPASD